MSAAIDLDCDNTGRSVSWEVVGQIPSGLDCLVAIVAAAAAVVVVVVAAAAAVVVDAAAVVAAVVAAATAVIADVRQWFE